MIEVDEIMLTQTSLKNIYFFLRRLSVEVAGSGGPLPSEHLFQALAATVGIQHDLLSQLMKCVLPSTDRDKNLHHTLCWLSVVS